MSKSTSTKSHPVKAVRDFFRVLDKADAAALAKFEEVKDRKISCFTCTEAHCCYQTTCCWLYEALPIAQRLVLDGKNTPELRAKLKEVGEAMEGTHAEPWFSLKQPCVFLKDKRCTVYEDRPASSCRTYFVVTPPDYCSPDNPHTTIGIVNHDEALEHVEKFGTSFEQQVGLRRYGMDKEGNRVEKPYVNPMRVLLGSVPRMVWIWLACWDSPTWKQFIKAQPWPTASTFPEWRQGNNPFTEKGNVYKEKHRG